MSQYSKNEIYKKVFNQFSESYNGENKNSVDSLEEINNLVMKIEKDLYVVINKIYHPQFLQGKEIKIDNLKNTALVSNQVNEIQGLPQNKNDLQFLARQLENFNSIQRELEEILRENFKNRRDEKDQNALSRRNSEVVMIDKDDLMDCNKRTPVTQMQESCMEAKINIEPNACDFNIEELTQLAEAKFKKILNDVRKINEYTKLPDNSSNY
jgi:hypothetical protein